jgi:hypothetical protein
MQLSCSSTKSQGASTEFFSVPGFVTRDPDPGLISIIEVSQENV